MNYNSDTLVFNITNASFKPRTYESLKNLNEFREINDYPAVVDFLSHYLPCFDEWLESQNNINKALLIKLGPARFLRASNYAYVESEEKLTVHNLTKGDVGTQKVNVNAFTPYFSWLKKKKCYDVVKIESNLKPVNFENRLEVSSENPAFLGKKLILELRDFSDLCFTEVHSLNLEFSNIKNSKLAFCQSFIVWYSYALGLSFQSYSSHHTIYKTFLGHRYHSGMEKVIFSNGNFQSISIIDSPIKIQLQNASFEYCKIFEDHLYITVSNGNIRNCNFDASKLSYVKRSERAELHMRMKELYSSLGKMTEAKEHFYKMKSERMLSFLNPRALDVVYYQKKSMYQKIVFHLSCFKKFSKHFLSKIFWGFGERPYRIIAFSTFLNFVFSIYYYNSIGSSKYKSVPKSISYSFYSFVNINKPQLEHLNYWVDVLSSIQGFTGLIFIGAFISALTKKGQDY